jgi:hypothetical protein
MTFPDQRIIDLIVKDPDIWMTTERMLSEDDENAYIELAYTDPKRKMSEADLVEDAFMYYTHKDDCCNPLDREPFEAKFINIYEIPTDPAGMKRAEIRIIKKRTP